MLSQLYFVLPVVSENGGRLENIAVLVGGRASFQFRSQTDCRYAMFKHKYIREKTLNNDNVRELILNNGTDILCDLTLSQTSFEDAGMYTHDSNSSRSGALLNVMDKAECYSDINSTVIRSRTPVLFRCVVLYSGIMIPVLSWIEEDGKAVKCDTLIESITKDVFKASCQFQVLAMFPQLLPHTCTVHFDDGSIPSDLMKTHSLESNVPQYLESCNALDKTIEVLEAPVKSTASSTVSPITQRVTPMLTEFRQNNWPSKPISTMQTVVPPSQNDDMMHVVLIAVLCPASVFLITAACTITILFLRLRRMTMKHPEPINPENMALHRRRGLYLWLDK